MATIYTSKKTGAQFTNLTALENGKFQLTSVEDPADVITTTESVLKRWYKKSVEVDFTTAEEKPEMIPMPGSEKLAGLYDQYSKSEPNKVEKRYFSKKPIGSKQVEGIPYGCIRHTIGYQSIPLKQAEKTFGKITVDKKSATVTSEGFGTRRVYACKASGNLFIRLNGKTVEFEGLTPANA